MFFWGNDIKQKLDFRTITCLNKLKIASSLAYEYSLALSLSPSCPLGFHSAILFSRFSFASRTTDYRVYSFLIPRELKPFVYASYKDTLNILCICCLSTGQNNTPDFLWTIRSQHSQTCLEVARKTLSSGRSSVDGFLWICPHPPIMPNGLRGWGKTRN